MEDLKISAVLIIHNDASLLEKAISSVQEYVDELIIVDGAYKWVAPFAKIFNEDAEESTDELKKVLSKFNIPTKYFKGTWENETHKRRFSLEKASYDLIMNIDSDEIFEVDWDKVKLFSKSNYAIGDCYFPLYFNPSHVGQATGLKTAPKKAIFVNKAIRTVDEIVDSMFLMVPKHERKQKLKNSDVFPEVLGTVHHLSNFRLGDGAYRRARFYNLLSFRVNEHINIGIDTQIKSDTHFVELINSLVENEKKALNNFFYFHRLAIGFPVLKNNQEIINTDLKNESIKLTIEETFNQMISDHNERLFSSSNIDILVFSNRPMFFELTGFIQQHGQMIEFHSDQFDFFDFTVMAEFLNGSRRDLFKKRLISENAQLNLNKELHETDFVDMKRLVLQVNPIGQDKLGFFKFKLSSLSNI